MNKYARTLIYALAAGCALALAFAASADTTCGANRQWVAGVGCTTAAGNAVSVDPSADTTSLEAEFCPTTVASTPLPASAILQGAKSFYMENRSSATCYARFDAASATSAGNSGFKWAPGTERAIDVSGTTFGARIRIACTAALTANACLWLQWFE
jgi:hypothetical protein